MKTISWLSLGILIACGGGDSDTGAASDSAADTAADTAGTDDSADSADSADLATDEADASDDAIPEQPEGGLPLLGGDCDPLVPAVCALPFPSDVYLADDPTGTNPSGRSVRFGETTMITRRDGTHVPPELFYDHDGFSPAAALLLHLPGATLTGCAGPYTIERSLEPSSPTVVMDAVTGERVPHWVELDSSALEGEPQLLMIRPARRLDDATRYLVAVRGIVDDGGQPIPASDVFSALVSGVPLVEGSPADTWSVHARRDLYADIFARLADNGVARDDLQLAWDFTTASREFITGPLVRMRDLALEAVGDQGPSFELASVEEFPTEADNPRLLRRIEVEVSFPLYLTSGAQDFTPDDPLARLSRGPDGDLVQNGFVTLPVLILVPRSVLGGERHGLLQNGHGLFGSRREGRSSYLARMANEYGYIAFSMNLFGFDELTTPFAAQTLLGRFEGFKAFPERQIQGMVNQLLAMRMMMGRVARDGIRDADGELLLDPAWIDRELRAYRGDSQGGIMGATYMAVSTDVTRGLLGETGMPYSLLLPRSIDWDLYHGVLKSGFGPAGDTQQLFLALMQMSWDRVEPSGFAPYLGRDTLPGTPAHHVLIHIARGDHQVSVHGARILARAVGAGQLVSDDPEQPVWEPIFGLPEVQAPLTEQSVYVEYEFDLPLSPETTEPQEEGCDPHDRVRILTPSNVQQDIFFRTGRIEWTCRGACGCDDSGADPGQEDGCPESYASRCE